jgi:hypothetical protein
MAAIEVLRGLGFGQAIQAAEVAAISYADSQVAQNTAMRITERAIQLCSSRGNEAHIILTA